MNLSQRILGLDFSPIRKFNKYAAEAEKKGIKVYKLNIGQPDIKTPPEFMDAVRAFDDEVLSYAESTGLPELKTAIKKYFARFDMDVDEEDILIANGGSEALTMTFASLLDEGDEVLMAEPFYTNYHTFVGLSGGKLVPITTSPEEGYRYAFADRIEKCITPNTKAISVVTPGNPTGGFLNREDMRVIADVAKKHDLWIVADEVYREFVYDGLEMISFGQLGDIEDRLIIIDSISKRFSACGARNGFIMSKNRGFIEHTTKLAQGRLCCPTLNMLGAAALYDLDPSYFEPIREEYESRRDAIYDALMKIEGVICHKPQGAFYMMAKLPVEDAEEFLMWMLSEFDDGGETVMYAPMAGFYGTEGLGRSEIRIAYVLTKEELVRSMEILKKAIEKYKSLGYK